MYAYVYMSELFLHISKDIHNRSLQKLNKLLDLMIGQILTGHNLSILENNPPVIS